jgi:hypothetical protein
MTDPTVECYSGHTYAQEPRAFSWQGRCFDVARIEQRWRTPHGPSFALRTKAGERFELHYDELRDRWVIHPLPAIDRAGVKRAKVLAFPSCGDRQRSPD